MSKVIYAPTTNQPVYSQQTYMRRRMQDVVQRYDGLYVEHDQNDPDPRRHDGEEVRFTDPTPYRVALPRPHPNALHIKPHVYDEPAAFSINLHLGQPRLRVNDLLNTYFVGVTDNPIRQPERMEAKHGEHRLRFTLPTWTSQQGRNDYIFIAFARQGRIPNQIFMGLGVDARQAFTGNLTEGYSEAIQSCLFTFCQALNNEVSILATNNPITDAFAGRPLEIGI